MPSPSLLYRSAVDVFWAELSACDHCLQIYESDAAFLDALEAFVAGGIRTGEAIIVIATEPHRRDLERRLRANAFDVSNAVRQDQLIMLDASQTLSRFMIDGWPDDTLFEQTLAQLLGRARKHHRRVRAFGEMVALLWADGHCAATIRLEHLWNRLSYSESFSLFCAYPKTGFTSDTTAGLQDICAYHNHLYAL